jgi:death on curing protein
MDLEYLTDENILFIHSILINETGGSHGVRDSGAISALVNLPRQKAFGKELYPTIFLKAAVYIRNIIISHPFIDGNKRTAMTSAAVFMDDNGCKILAIKGEIEAYALKIISDRETLEDIAEWLKKNSRKIHK